MIPAEDMEEIRALQRRMTDELDRARRDATHWAHVAPHTYALTDRGFVHAEPVQDLGRAIAARLAPGWSVSVTVMTDGSASVVITGRKGAGHGE